MNALTPEEQRLILRHDLPSFVRLVFALINPGVIYLENWHIHAICHVLEQVMLGRIRRLIITMPPRSLKSIITSVAFPAFVLGRDPKRQIVCISYAHDLAIKHGNDTRRVMQFPWYRALFPTRISSRKNTEFEFKTTAGGSRLSTSAGGALTGRGGDIIIIDDILKAQDANSEAAREATNDWYRQTLLSRLNNRNTGAIIIVQQRLHQNDLVGSVLTDGADDWVHLNLPAIATVDQCIQIGPNRSHHRKVDDVLHPERESHEQLMALKRQLGSDTFAAQYQQEPVPPGGLMIRRDWVQCYETLPPRSYGSRIVQSWDTALKAGPDNDWSVCTTWLMHENRYYLVDLVRERLDYPGLRRRARELARHHEPQTILIEDVGTGTALIQELGRECSGVIGIRPEHDKRTRMSIQAAKFEAGQVFLPIRAPWLADLEAELFSFPGGRHDDQVDSISQMLAWENKRYRMLDPGVLD